MNLVNTRIFASLPLYARSKCFLLLLTEERGFSFSHLITKNHAKFSECWQYCFLDFIVSIDLSKQK